MNSRSIREDIPATVTPVPDDSGFTGDITQGDRPDMLQRIRNPSVALAMWHRRLPEGVDSWISSLSPDRMPCGRVLTNHGEVRRVVDEFFEQAGTPGGRDASLLKGRVSF